ncbi:hypothetical protein OG730_38335 [Streptomyces sp. NBC_01298]|uniref:Ku protein n=1 Tax=Streptomyces sp. NBC_01298 TaxID=2903817 RepID=UPI002E128357|nr:hypothetical protein OG730_38335 [Streptomyces sp. NBC_01298]
MARPVWAGVLSFGLVSLPVGLYTATDSHTIHFHQLQRGTSDRVRNKRVNERTGEEVPFEEIVKGFDDGDAYVLVEPGNCAWPSNWSRRSAWNGNPRSSTTRSGRRSPP